MSGALKKQGEGNKSLITEFKPERKETESN